MFCISVKIKLFVPLLCACALPGKVVPEMTYDMSGGMLNPTTHSVQFSSVTSLCMRLKNLPSSSFQSRIARLYTVIF